MTNLDENTPTYAGVLALAKYNVQRLASRDETNGKAFQHKLFDILREISREESRLSRVKVDKVIGQPGKAK